MLRGTEILLMYLVRFCFSKEIFGNVQIETTTLQKASLSDYGINMTSISFQLLCKGEASIYLSNPLENLEKRIDIQSRAPDYVSIDGSETSTDIDKDLLNPFWIKWTKSGDISFGRGDDIDDAFALFTRCSDGTYGEFCELMCGNCLCDVCDRYTGYCTNGCEVGWIGANCSEDIDPCSEFPCYNGGTCDSSTGTAICSCTSRFRGTNCEAYFDPCSNWLCENGGKCVDINGNATCSCLQPYIGPHCETMIEYTPQLNLLWPLDNTTYTTELLARPNVSVNCSQCLLQFGSAPFGYPNDIIQLDGTCPLDLEVDVTAYSDENFAFSMIFNAQVDSGTLMNYRSNDQTKQFKEMLLYMNSGKLVMERVLNNRTEVFNPIQPNISVDSWYFIAYGIDKSKGTMDLTVDENVYQLDDNFLDEIGIELPGRSRGVLRIRGAFDKQKTKFTGRLGCVGFFMNVTQPHRADIEPLCKSGLWSHNMPDCHTLYLKERTTSALGYFKKETGMSLNALSLLWSSTQCTMLQCALSCLINLWCWFFHFDSSVTGCQPCLLYDSTV